MLCVTQTTITLCLHPGQDAVNSPSGYHCAAPSLKTVLSDLWSSVLGEEGKLLESLTMSGLSVYNDPPTGACLPQPSQPLNPSASYVYACLEGAVRYYITRIQQLRLSLHTLGQAARDMNYGILEKGGESNITTGDGRVTTKD